MTEYIEKDDARQGRTDNRVRYILTISLSLAISALLGVAYVYI